MIQKEKISEGFKLRKFLIWLASLAVVLIAYLLYSGLSERPQIDTPVAVPNPVADANIPRFGRQIGRIGGVGVETVQNAKYTHLNEQKQVDREFGFRKLLHEAGDEWEVEKPFMNVFQGNFKCYLTADKGNILLEDAIGNPSPKYATFTDNVVMHILPEESSDTSEGFVYLDDVVFISEHSQFSTSGPVKFTSRNAEMLGTGLELIYNEELGRLEFLRIADLEILHFKNPQADLFSEKAPGGKPSAKTAELSQPARSDKITAESRKTKGETYRFVFSKNVVIDCPEQLILADEVRINNLSWSKTPGEKSDEADSVATDNANVSSTTVSKPDEPNDLPQESGDIIVTCDGGIIVTPMDSPGMPDDVAKRSTGPALSTGKVPKKALDDAVGRTIFTARKIDYCASTGDVTAGGPLELTFYVDVNDLLGEENKKRLVPVKVTAKKQARFPAALGQVIFEGDCFCTMLREDPNTQQKYTLSAPKLTVDLPKDANSRAAMITRFEHLCAEGGTVKLATVKTAGEKLLGGVELKCAKFDYDTDRKMFLATGPGIIKVDNSNISEPEPKAGKFSLRRQCCAVVQDFGTLRYFLEANRIVADAEREPVVVDYVPVIDGQYGRHVTATAGHVEALLYETADSQTELSTLTASGIVTYEDEENEFIGSKLFYDADKSIMTVQGDRSQGCYFNGGLFKAIEYDLKTGKVNFEITTPGALQMGR